MCVSESGRLRGGSHPGLGTRNAILALGPTTYLEVIGPDLKQSAPPAGRWFGIDALVEPRLVAWAVKDSALESRFAQALSAGFPVGPVESAGRERPDGQLLRWQFTHPRVLAAQGVVPFFIHWGGAHPANIAPQGLRFVSLRAEHPNPVPVRALLRQFGLCLNVEAGEPRLVATLETPRGRMELS